MEHEDQNVDTNRLKSLAEIDRIIHEPVRLMLMTHLYVVESADFLFLKRHTGLTWGNLSSHMSKLETAGYIEIKKVFIGKKPQTMLFLTEKGKEAFQAYRLQMKHVFDDLTD